MLNKIKFLRKEFHNRVKEKYDYTKPNFDDSVAEKTDWTLIESSASANFQITKLVRVTPSVYTIKLTLMAKIFLIIFSVTSLGALFYAISQLGNNNPDTPIAFIFAIGGAAFSIALFKLNFKHIIIDKSKGYIFSKKIKNSSNRRIKTGKLSFTKIHAIQLISDMKEVGTKDFVQLFQLNLVLNNAYRFHINDYSSQAKNIYDAEILSELLEVPIWNYS